MLCGYQREIRPGQSDWIRFIRHDDQRGPYLVVDDVLNDVAADGYEYSPWKYLVVPLPEKVWLTAKPTEASGARLLPALARDLVSAVPGSPARELLDKAAAGEIRLRTYMQPANQFKRRLIGRVDPVLQREYRMARFPRYIWIVEAIDRIRRQGGASECVLGEAVFEGTSSGLRPQALALHVPGAVVVFPTDGPARGPILFPPDPYATGGEGPA